MAETLRQGGNPWEQPLLVPIPSWKRQANPLPGLLCGALEWAGGLRQTALLERSRPVLGQHHLGRDLRLANQAGAFRCRRPPGVGERARRPLLIVDDILTTGATVCSAAAALQQDGWRVLGAVCLARTPEGARQAVL
jgi:predicted amidophosphoribosyltransferase